jgi:hypothetical protein
VNLLEYLVDVGRVGLCSLLLALLLVTIGCRRGLLCGLSCLASGGLCRTSERSERVNQSADIPHEVVGSRHSLPAFPPVDAGAFPPVEAGAFDAALGGMFD